MNTENYVIKEPLYVSRPLLPDVNLLTRKIQEIWNTGYVTNHGPVHCELEKRLSDFLNVNTAMLFNNGTIALLASLRLFDLPAGSEVITTPMTFAATAHSIAWNNLNPVFADIKEDNLTLDPESVVSAITKKTSAILAVHVYGCICDHFELKNIAEKYSLKLIYDSAHAFGSTLNGVSVAELGDASVFSFHATKLFNTLEGGLITTRHDEYKDKLYLIRNFGIKNEEEVKLIGINGKLNEVQAAIGLLNLDLYETEKNARKRLRDSYRTILSDIEGITIQEVGNNVTQSEQYFLIRIKPHKFGRHRDEIKKQLEEKNIFCRKYFYPLCTDYEPYKDLPIISTLKQPYAEIAKQEVLCLPFHSGVRKQHLDLIADVFYQTKTVIRSKEAQRKKIVPLTETHEIIVGSENLGLSFRSIYINGIEDEIYNGLKVIERILSSSDYEINSREFLLDCFYDYGIPYMESDIFEEFQSIMNKSGFGPIQFPTEFIDFVRRLIRLEIRTFAEIGSYRGGSAYFICAVLQRVDKDFSLTIIDPVDNLLGFDVFRKKLNLIKKIPSTSRDFKCESFDFVFIDGAHDFDSVIEDYYNLGKSARVGVAFHDIFGHEFDSLNGGVVKAWNIIKNELRSTHEVCEYAHSVERSLGIGLALRS